MKTVKISEVLKSLLMMKRTVNLTPLIIVADSQEDHSLLVHVCQSFN